jgi:ribonuclease HI
MQSVISILCDGLCEPRNPGGWACWAWLARSPKGATLQSAYGCLGHGPDMTNNRAEYAAVIEALTYASGRLDLLVARGMGVAIHSDSQLVINQITGAYRINHAHLAELRQQIVQLESRFVDRGVPLAFTWIPREQNTEADALTRQAYREARGDTADLEPGEFLIPADANVQACRSCGASIVWTRTPNGKPVPLSLALVEERGGVRITKTHFVDCEQSREWRRT